jgi:hypothetical protein
MDAPWWDTYGDEVQRDFVGARYSNNPVKYAQHLANFKHYSNSGAACISLAVAAGASRVIMLGYDCQHTGGVTHWHGNHPKGMTNARGTDKWHEKFAELSADAEGVEIINCSRTTALRCFPQGDLAYEIAR